MSSAMWLWASGASRSKAHGNVMPVPINWHGAPTAHQPSGRTRLRTRQANADTRARKPAPAGAFISYSACTGRPLLLHKPASVSSAPSSSKQSASTITTIVGGCAHK
jgi:hypothetical protein